MFMKDHTTLIARHFMLGIIDEWPSRGVLRGQSVSMQKCFGIL